MYRHKLLQRKKIHSEIVSSIKTTMYERCQETVAHADRMVELSLRLGRILRLSENQLNELELFTSLHDIGKISTESSILNKPEKLSEAEWVEIKKHPEIGYRIAQATPELTPIADYILCHHERWDGGGYPSGLSGDAIPLHSRILAIIDSYDVMTHDQPYRSTMPREEALNEIRRGAGRQYDPYIANVFVDMIMKDNKL
jgi:HD-GYP domain-containing protein (c-di-GMP phosphodiesterase class II)